MITQQVHDDRQQHPLALGDGIADDELVRVAIVEIEMNQR